ncbi:hypothetical protein F2Q70_00000400 [Brassica cretica]|uniref:TFIID subunit TAF5 NTD2 domain-containing protein n=1 Tax=Brassica cretica TaxID=69181 RepID=A0A8S9IWK3_BRACR|nr:hypothetical protein F2Q70_00000400 [Brassica cretica]
MIQLGTGTHELLRVMYPVFIHCYMDLVGKGHTQEARSFFNSFRRDHEMIHLRDLQKLEGVLVPSHLEEMEFARSLRQSKVNIKICQYSYDLLLQYLHRTESTLMLGIINEHINFQVYSGQPNSSSDDIDAVTIVGSFQETADHVNQKEIQWGLLEDSLEDRLEKTGSLLSDSEKGQGESKDGDIDDSKKRSNEIGKQGSSLKKLKKDKAGNATAKVARQETSTVSPAPRVKPELALPVMSTDVEESILEDLRNRVQLSSVAMPSVSFYTFVNTHNGLNCASISHDGSLVAGGFSDSSIKVWDMAKIGQAGSGALQDESDTNDQNVGPNGRRNYTLLLGHSGPVYSATFSPPGDFVLSSSADTTIRLWSTQLNANLVCYKGHNYPVWDVQFSPFGHYFASCSHDRTARIWSMDRVQPLRIMAGHLSDVDRRGVSSGFWICGLHSETVGRHLKYQIDQGRGKKWKLEQTALAQDFPHQVHTSSRSQSNFLGEICCLLQERSLNPQADGKQWYLRFAAFTFLQAVVDQKKSGVE